LTYTITANTNSGLFDGTTIDGVAGTLTLDYTANKGGTADITVRATDNSGLWVEDTFTVTVTARNDTPTTSNIANINVNEDAVDTVINLFGEFDDVEDADADLTYTITSNTNGGLFDATNIDGVAGTLTLDYTTNQSGVSDITIRATDTGGLWVEDTFTVTVIAQNDTPIAVDDAVFTEEDTPITTQNLLANDSDIDGDPLIVDSFTQPAHGSVVYNGNGTFTYIPDANYYGIDSFAYTITDGSGGFNTATVNITIDDMPEPELQPTIELQPTNFTTPIVIFPTDDNSPINPDDIFNPVNDSPKAITTPDNDTLLGPIDSDDPVEGANQTTSEEDKLVEDESVSGDHNTSDDSTGLSEKKTHSGADSATQPWQWKTTVTNYNIKGTTLESHETGNRAEINHSTEATQSTTGVVDEAIGVDVGVFDNLEVNGTVQFHPDAVMLQDEMFQQRLDTFTEEVDDQIDSQLHTETIAVGVVTGVTGTVSFGYGLWALKGGSLLASMASSLPVLSSIDPLPILEQSEKKSLLRHRHPKANPVIEDADEIKISALLK